MPSVDPQGSGPQLSPPGGAVRPRRVLGLQLGSIPLACGEISYVDEGAGPTIVLLHGAPFTSLGFVRLIRELARHHRVIAPDLPGFGYSQASPAFAGSLASYADFVEQFCRALELRAFFFYVNDASGCFGLVAAARLAPDVAGLVVADTVPLPLTGMAWLVKQVLKRVVSSRPVRYVNRRLNLLPWLVATVAPFLRPFSADERAVLTAQFDTPGKRDRIIDLFEQMGRDEAFLRGAAAAARDYLGEKPALILYGQFDPVRLIGGVARFRRLFRNHVVQIIAFEEHFPILASAERVARVVRQWILDVLPPGGRREGPG
jgi:haloalkane dehalogenase